MNLKHANVSLVRNVLRDLMSKDRLRDLIDLLGRADRERRRIVYDFLLVVTGNHEFYPATGTRFTPDQWKAHQAEWLEWFDDHRESLSWDRAKGRFTGWE